MKRNLVVIPGLCIGVLMAAAPVLAHHALAAEFDSSKPIKLTATVKSVDWMNPHIYVNVEAKDETGKTVMYSVEGGPPNALFRNGWRKDSLKPGDVVQVIGVKAKKADSNRIGNAKILMPDGKPVFSARNGGEQQ